MTEHEDQAQGQVMPPETWHVLVCGLPLAEKSFDLGASLTLRRLAAPLSIFDLAGVGAVGFRQWAALEPLAASATAEIWSPTNAATKPGYDALNKCWLISALLVLRGFARHICPACSGYSWNLIAGHQKTAAPSFNDEHINSALLDAMAADNSNLTILAFVGPGPDQQKQLGRLDSVETRIAS